MRGTSLEIRLLGRLEVLREGRALDLPRSRKARALLAYLAATARGHGREHLCDLLWEGPADPRAALRGALSKLRPLLDDDRTVRLVAEGDRVSFDANGSLVDVAAVRAVVSPPVAADLASLEGAAARFRGGFLEGLGIPGCYRFDAWCTAERESVRRLRVSLLCTLIERLRDEPEKALRHARERLILDPCVEAANIDVIRLLCTLGRTREALEQYETCRRVLMKELGVRPSAELDAVRRRITPVYSAVPVTARVPARATESGAPLVGRRREREILEEIFRGGMRDTGRLLLFVGEPGIGKTRLLEEVGRTARSAGAEVLSGRSFEAELIRPYGAWIDVLRCIPQNEIPSGLHAELALLLPELGPAPSESADRARLFEAVARLITDRGNHGSAIAIVLDDVQWLDEASAALLHFVARQLARSRLLIACASRRAELEDNPVAARLLRTLRRENLLRQLELGPLDARATADLVRRVDPERDAARVFAESAGNPLFALELARARERDGMMLPGTLGDLIDDRLNQLGPEARGLLQWTAAIGRDFDLVTLARVADVTATELLRGVEELERRGLLRVHGNGYDFTHDLIRKAAYQRMSKPRRQLVHLRIAPTLRDMDDPGHELAGEVAHHAALGGDDELAARACLAAARRALWTFASEEAAELAARGIAHVDRLRPETRLELHIELLGLSVYPGMKEHRFADVEADLSRAIAEARAAGLNVQTHRGFQLIADLHFIRGDFGGALDGSLRAQEAGRAADPATVVRAIGDTARCLGILDRDMARAEKLAREADALAKVIGYVGHELPQALGYVHHHAGRLDDAIASFERAAQLARDERERWFECACLSRIVMIELERGRPEAPARCRDLVDVTKNVGEGSDAPFAEALEALARRWAGDANTNDALDHALQRLRDADSRWMVAYVQNHAALADLDSGDTDSAGRRAREALEAATIAGRTSEIAIARAVLARLALARGDREAAAAQVEATRSSVAGVAALSARARAALESIAAAAT